MGLATWLMASVLLGAVDVDTLDDPQGASVTPVSVEQQGRGRLAPWVPGLLLQAYDDLPGFPWDPFTVLIQRTFLGIGTGFVIGGCGCCLTGLVAMFGAFAISARGTGNAEVDAAAATAVEGLQVFLVLGACLLFTPPTLLLWGSAVPFYLGGSLVDVFKSPRQRAIERDQAQQAAEARRVADQQRAYDQQNAPYDDGNNSYNNNYNNGGTGRRPDVRGRQPNNNNDNDRSPSRDNTPRTPTVRSGDDGAARAREAQERQRKADEDKKKREEEERKKKEEEEKKRTQQRRNLPPPGFK